MKPKHASQGPQQGSAILTWPEGAAAAAGISAPQLQRLRAQGDAPQLYAVSERVLVTTEADLLAWIRAKAVPPTYKCRPATVRGSGASREQGAA